MSESPPVNDAGRVAILEMAQSKVNQAWDMMNEVSKLMEILGYEMDSDNTQEDTPGTETIGILADLEDLDKWLGEELEKHEH